MGQANLCTRVGFLQLRAGGKSVKGLRLPEVHLRMSAILPPPEITWSSRAFQRKTVEWALAGCDPQTLPQVASLGSQGNWSQEDGASEVSLLGGHAVRHSKRGSAPTPEPK